MSKGGYIEKIPIKRLGAGGAKYIFKITESGSKQLARLRDYKLLTRGVSFSELDSKAKEMSLNRMVNVFKQESYDIIEDLIDYATKSKFDMAPYDIQKDIIDRINAAVKRITDKTNEIAESFF